MEVHGLVVFVYEKNAVERQRGTKKSRNVEHHIWNGNVHTKLWYFFCYCVFGNGAPTDEIISTHYCRRVPCRLQVGVL